VSFVTGSKPGSKVQPGGESPKQSAEHERVAQLPEHIAYSFLFHRISNLKQQADLLRDQGRDGSGFRRRFIKQFALDEDQFEKISEIATDTEAIVAGLDKKADDIIDEFRKRFPEGRLPPGVVPPPPPAELFALQQQRDETLLHGRDRMRAELGEREFTRFDEILKIHLSRDVTQMDQK
jgi:hypothetical protein